MSETALARSTLEKYCTGLGIDIGFGGSAITPNAITFDMPTGYCPSIEGHTQILRGDCRNMPYLCDNAMDYIYSSHLLEDFHYSELPAILKEWRRVLKPGGLLITNCPDQQRFLAHCTASGQGLNLAHKEQDFSLANFMKYGLNFTGPWEELFRQEQAGPYSWYLVVRKVS